MTDSTISSEPGVDALGVGLMTGAQAEQALRSAIQRLERGGDESLELAQALVKLGVLRQEKGGHSEGEELFGRALDISERMLGSEHIELVQPLTSLGASRILRGAPEMAAPLLNRALSISTRYLGEGHPDLVIMVNDIARLYLKHGAFSFAEPQLQRLLSMKRTKGDDHPEVATVLASLAAVNQARGLHEAAEDLWRKVLAIRERTLAPNHFAQAIALEHLADVCTARGKVDEALQLFKRAQMIREMTLGNDHASLRILRERIADLQLQASEDSSEVHYPRAADLKSGDARAAGSFGGSHPAGGRPARETKRRARTESAVPFVEREVSSPVPTNLENTRATGAAFTDDAEEREAAALAHRAAWVEQRQSAYDEDDEESGGGVREIFAPVNPFLRKHRGEALAVAGVLAVLVIAVATTSRASSEIEQPLVESPLAATGSSPATALRPLAATSAQIKESAPINSVPSQAITALPSRVVERRNTEKVSERRAAPPSISIPTVPSTMTNRFDSLVRAAGASARIPDLAISGSSPEFTNSSRPGPIFTRSEAGTEGPSHSRLIGPLPTPRYPGQLPPGVQGEVVVRFNVDPVGQPMMATFWVVKSPHDLLTAAVRRVIQDLKFEPARSGGAESKPTFDQVEIRYVFSPSGR